MYNASFFQKLGSPMSVSSSPGSFSSSSSPLLTALKQEPLSEKRMSLDLELSGAFIQAHDLYDDFYTVIEEQVKTLPNIKLAVEQNQSLMSKRVNLTSSMRLPEAVRKNFPMVLDEIQALIVEGKICDSSSQKLLIYNYQHYAMMHDIEEAYSLELSIVNIDDMTGDISKGDIINLSI